MLDVVRKDILTVLEKAIEILKQEDHAEHALGELSNHVIHDASIFQDDDSTSIAVLIYALSKVVAMCCEKNISCAPLVKQLETAYALLSQKDFNKYRTTIRETFNQIKKLDARLKEYIQEVLDAARIKKGSKMHMHGISTARTAELLGITQWELQDYVGKQQEWEIKEMPVSERLAIARELFR